MKVLSSCYIFTLHHLLHPFYCFFLFSILSFIGSFLTIPICISLSCLPIGSPCSTIHFFFFLIIQQISWQRRRTGEESAENTSGKQFFYFSQVAPESFGCIINRLFIWVQLSSLSMLPSFFSSFQLMFVFVLFFDAFCMPGYVLGDGAIQINKHFLAISEFSVQRERVQ